MQILPTTRQEALGDHLFASLNPSTEEGSTSFADELMRYQSAQKAVDTGDSHSVSAALVTEQQSTAPLVEAPYSRNTTDGVTYTVEEVCFTKQDLRELRQKMEQAGAPTEALAGLDKLAQQPDGATLSQVLASLHQLQTPPALSDSDINTLKSLCERIDSTGKLGTNVLDLLGKGQGKQALEMLTQAMGQLPPGTRITLEKDEMAVLSRALGLSANTQKQLQGDFGPYKSLSLNAADFSKLMGTASSEFVQRDVTQQKLDKALDATLNPILKKAKERMKTEQDASALSSRRAEQSKTIIEKTLLRNVNATLEGTQAAQTEQAAGSQEGLKQAVAARAGQQAEQMPLTQAHGQPTVQNPQADKQTTGTNKPNAEQVKGAGEGVQNASGLQADTGKVRPDSAIGNENKQGQLGDKDDKGNKGEKGDKDKKNAEGWEGLLGKTDVIAGTTPTTTTATNAPLVGMAVAAVQAGIGAGAGASVENLAANQSTQNRAHISRQMTAQVEQGMLSAMRDGTKRLELQLHPGELGNLTLMLSVRNGEVSATIRSEKSETTELLNRQLDMLRTNLEQQGIKVDKLEVQTQLADGNSHQQWDGMQQHNARQEENARRDDMERLRNLGRVRNNSTNSGEIALEQAVQLERYTAGNAAQGIYIVA